MKGSGARWPRRAAFEYLPYPCRISARTSCCAARRLAGSCPSSRSCSPPHNAGPPLHTHDFDEAFYMLEGELIFQVEDALVTKGPGELLFAPRNVAHALANHGDAPARYVLVCTPAGFERSRRRASPPRHPVAARLRGREEPPAVGAPARGDGHRPASSGTATARSSSAAAGRRRAAPSTPSYASASAWRRSTSTARTTPSCIPTAATARSTWSTSRTAGPTRTCR